VPDSIEIQPLGPLDARIRPPGSKSITNRALVCAALAEGRSVLSGALASDDTQVMIQSLRKLGIPVDSDSAAQRMTIAGRGGRLAAGPQELFVGNSGTTVRFLTALVTLGEGPYRLDGVPRMRQRPIEDLMTALRQWGAEVESEAGTGCPPIEVRAGGLPGGAATIRGDLSSQYLSAMLMVAPYARNGATINVDGPLVSKPYVEMTLAVMRAFGVDVNRNDLARFEIVPARYQARDHAIEPDASAASYFFAAAAICGGRVTVEGLTPESLQGDLAFCECLRQMGCNVEYGTDTTTVTGGSLVGIDVDMNAISDTVQTLAAVAAFARGPTTIRNVGHIRHKETDRLADLATELRKLGPSVEEHGDGLTITPAGLHGATIDTYDDHRMAMSLALVGLRVPGVKINDPNCTAKTYPEFFRDLARLDAKD